MNWRKIFRPSATLSIFILVVGGAVFGALAFWTGQVTLHATSTDEFCMTCHSNHSLLEEVRESPHGNNAAGIHVHCRDCHLPNESFAYLRKKIAVSPDLWRFVTTSGFNTQEHLEEHRLEWAELTHAYLRSIDSSTCADCHSRIYDDPPPAEMSRMAVNVHRFNANRDADERQTCIDCHKGVAHPYPEA